MRKKGIIRGTIVLLLFCSARVGAQQQLTPEEEMLRAVESCDLGKVKALSLQRADLLQIKDRDRRTLLHLTARCKDIALARFLIERKANVNALDPNGWTPLHYAASSNNLSLVKLLAASHGQINMTDAAGLTPLFKGNDEIARFLLSSGADLYAEDQEGQTVLHKRPEKAFIKLLADRGLDINIRDYKGRTPLHSAAQAISSYCLPTRTQNFVSSVLGSEDVGALLMAGADINARDAEGVTPLMLGSNSAELVNLLLSRGADINAQDSSGYTLLHRVVRSSFNPSSQGSGHGESQDQPPRCGLDLDPVNKLAFLLGHGANPNLKDRNGVTVLGALAKVEDGSNLVNAARVLLSHHADLNATDKDGNTILHLAAAARNAELIEFLLKDQGLKPDRTNPRGETPLHMVADVKTATVLLKYKADLQVRDNQYESPVYKAVLAGRVELVKLLLNTGADLHGNINGVTMLHVAARNADVPVMELLLKAGLEVNAGGPTLRRPLHEAARSSSPNALEAIKFLLARGASVNLRDKTNSTPLLEVVSKDPSASMLEEVKLLLAHGADANAKNEEGKTPLEIAKYQRQWRANLHSSEKSENDRFLANVRRLEEVVAFLEKIPVVTVPERRIFGRITMPDGTPVEAIVALRDNDEPATKFEVLSKNGKFEFRLGEGHHFYIMALYDTNKDGKPVRYVGLLWNKTVNGDMGPIEIMLDHYVRRN